MSKTIEIGPYSAYAIAVKYGYVGTEEDWIKAVEAARKSAETSAANAKQKADEASASAATATEQAGTATTKAGESAASADASASSASAAAISEANAKKYSEEAGAKANTDKTLSIENAPADAKATGDALAGKADKSTVQDESGNSIFYSKAEVDAKIKDAIAAALSERDERDHDVGSFYASDNPTSPAQKYGGTWERIKGKFIMGASDTYPAGSTGGEAEHTLTESELPNIIGSVDFQSDGNSQGIVNGAHGVFRLGQISTGGFRPNNRVDEDDIARQIIMSFGSGSPHNNMPPYYSMYIWRRVA